MHIALNCQYLESNFECIIFKLLLPCFPLYTILEIVILANMLEKDVGEVRYQS